MIRIDNARKQFGDLVAVNDVTTTIPAHGVTSIIGPNGGGKSTLLSLISRLAPMDGGRIEWVASTSPPPPVANSPQPWRSCGKKTT